MGPARGDGYWCHAAESSEGRFTVESPNVLTGGDESDSLTSIDDSINGQSPTSVRQTYRKSDRNQTAGLIFKRRKGKLRRSTSFKF